MITMPVKYRSAILVAMALAAMLLLALLPQIPQNPGYHDFADSRDFASIPNCLNVVSSLAYVVVGLAGLVSAWRRSRQPVLPGMVLYRLFFLGIVFTGLASAGYHLDPDNASLARDRLAMSMAFMSLFSIVIHERISAIWGAWLAAPLMLLGMLSVWYWFHTESLQQGDLRLYVLVQFLPLIMLPFILLMYKTEQGGDSCYWMLILCYLLAKLAEHFDDGIMNLSGHIVSGHTLKHLISAVAAWFMVLLFSRRRFRAGVNSA